MHPQYIAPYTDLIRSSDAGEPQTYMMNSCSYHLFRSSRSFGLGYTQVTKPQNARRNWTLSGFPRVDKIKRRLTCLRASRAFALYLCWYSWQHVAITTQVTLKNSWSLTRFRLPLSQPSTANTTKVVILFPRQALAPASHHHQSHQHFDQEAA